jgi:mRNA interferase RelE/StbE
MYNFSVASGYEVEIENSAAKVLQRLQRHDLVRVSAAIVALGDDPRPHGCVKLSGFDSTYRIRVGDYRIVYLIADGVHVVTVTRIGHRREVYQ